VNGASKNNQTYIPKSRAIDRTAQVGESIVHGHAYDTKNTTLSGVNVFPYKLKAWIRRDVSLDTRMGLEESFFAFPAQGVGGRIRSSEWIRYVWHPRRLQQPWGAAACSYVVSNMRPRCLKVLGFGGRNIEDISVAERGVLKNWSL